MTTQPTDATGRRPSIRSERDGSIGRTGSTATSRASGAAVPRPGVSALCGRVARIVRVLTVRSLSLGVATVGALARRRSAADYRGAWLVDTITDLGPAFVKAAQMLSTRADLVPPSVCRALSGLYDDVRPIPARELMPLLERRLGLANTRAILADNAPVAAGSIACVYHATLPDGREVAVKVRRPDVARTLGIDLAIMRGLTRLVARVPLLRDVPAVDIVDQVTESVYGQLDLLAECDNLERLRVNLAKFPDVRVPAVHRDLCGEDVVVMEYLQDLRRLRPEDMTGESKERAVLSALHAVYQMLFHDGLVHCDLHPGNLYLRQDGSVVIVDAGFTVQLRPQAQDKFASFFHQMANGNGRRCAEIVLSTAKPGPNADTGGFCRELSGLVESVSGVRAADFDLVRFATKLFDIQRRYGLYADPQFVFPILSLMVLEGTVRDFAPDIDFQREALPFLAQGVLERAIRAWQATLPEQTADGSAAE
ncbi:ubiquinone biosynthesis protein [Lentzea atacamensis]|uniref:Ubiquinone biosynthesis protein n=1 Tax=Lentzea atacamensis TaxID=531938 RepID=A0ABX9E0C3_9PSEU|nr:ubiquinone biosynthesis protein [Lentzea atacamensis]